MIAKVVSAKMKNTVVVEVERFFSHPIYKKRLKRTSRFQAHDELGAKQGDQVRIEPVRPISKNKYHKVTEIINQSAPTVKESKKETDSEVSKQK